MSAAPLYSESVIMLQLSVIFAQMSFECNKIYRVRNVLGPISILLGSVLRFSFEDVLLFLRGK